MACSDKSGKQQSSRACRRVNSSKLKTGPLEEYYVRTPAEVYGAGECVFPKDGKQYMGPGFYKSRHHSPGYRHCNANLHITRKERALEARVLQRK